MKLTWYSEVFLVNIDSDEKKKNSQAKYINRNFITEYNSFAYKPNVYWSIQQQIAIDI